MRLFIQQPAHGQLDVFLLPFAADKPPSGPRRRDSGRAAAGEWIEHQIPRIGRGQDDPPQQLEGLLRRMLAACLLGLDGAPILHTDFICLPPFSRRISW